MAAMAAPVFTAEQTTELTTFVNGLIEERLGRQFPRAAMEFLDSISDPSVSPIEVMRRRLDVLSEELNLAMPNLTKSVDEAMSKIQEAKGKSDELDERARLAFDNVEGRFREISTQIGKQLVELQGQQASVEKMNEGITNHRNDVEAFVRNALNSVGSAGGQGQGGGKGGGGRTLNDPKSSTVDSLTDSMTKSAFVLWRENLDIHLEMHDNFGIGIDSILRQVRLYSGGIIGTDQVDGFAYKLTAEANEKGKYDCLGNFRTGLANRELYSFLNQRLTPKLKASAMVTCRQGEGFKLY